MAGTHTEAPPIVTRVLLFTAPRQVPNLLSMVLKRAREKDGGDHGEGDDDPLLHAAHHPSISSLSV